MAERASPVCRCREPRGRRCHSGRPAVGRGPGHKAWVQGPGLSGAGCSRATPTRGRGLPLSPQGVWTACLLEPKWELSDRGCKAHGNTGKWFSGKFQPSPRLVPLASSLGPGSRSRKQVSVHVSGAEGCLLTASSPNSLTKLPREGSLGQDWPESQLGGKAPTGTGTTEVLLKC